MCGEITRRNLQDEPFFVRDNGRNYFTVLLSSFLVKLCPKLCVLLRCKILPFGRGVGFVCGSVVWRYGTWPGPYTWCSATS